MEGRGGNKKLRGMTSKSKTGDVSTKDTQRLTIGDDNYPTDVRNAKVYWKNWSEIKGVLSEITNQGNLDTCWVHATIQCLEALLKIKFNLDISLSATHLYHGIEKKKGNSAVKNFEEIGNFLKMDGIVREKDCECKKRTNKKDPCSKKIKENRVPVLKIDDLVITKTFTEEELVELVKVGPVIASLDATAELKDHHGEEIYFGPKMTRRSQGNHVVLVIGYGTTTNGQHYWIIQNSWGTNWGDRGFAKLSREISRGKDQHSLFAEFFYPRVSVVEGLV